MRVGGETNFFKGLAHRAALLQDRLDDCRRRIADAARAAGRSPDDVSLVVVSKTNSVAEIRAAYDLGIRDFAENRPAELLEKIPQLPNDIRWHFIGPLQANRVAKLRERIHLLHSLDRTDLAAKWADAWRSSPVLLQVNVAREPQKRGVSPEDVPASLAALEAAGVACVGLTVMPPFADDPEESAPWFAAARALRDALLTKHPRLVHLSMGTTQDFEVAIREGATIVRVRRAIFDPPAEPPA